MPIYDRPAKDIMREWANENIKPGEIFKKSDPVAWFRKRYPKIKSSTVEMHVEVMAINNGRLRRHHPSVHEDSGHDLFFKVGPGRFRLWQPEADPEPVYDAFDGKGPALIDTNDEKGTDETDIEQKIGSDAFIEAREFAYEKDLQNYLEKNLELIEKGLHLYEDEGIKGVEFSAGGRFIDLLAVDESGGFVVLELKVSKGYDRVVGQLARYMAWVSKNMETVEPVRGIIVANCITEDLKLAASLIPNVELIEYEMHFEIRHL